MSDKMREDFSKHCHLWRYSEEVDENGFFTNPTTQRAWDVWAAAWQSSRAAIVVSLPDWREYDTPRQAINACECSLKHAGVKVTYD